MLVLLIVLLLDQGSGRAAQAGGLAVDTELHRPLLVLGDVDVARSVRSQVAADVPLDHWDRRTRNCAGLFQPVVLASYQCFWPFP